jgi:hypothetical protein
MIKNFHDYLNEASLNRHPALPGGKEGTDSYKRQIEIYSKEQIRDLERRYGPDMGRLPSIDAEVQEIQRGYEKDIEILAEKALRILYGRIIEDVTLDIKFPKPGEIPEMMKDVPNKSPKEAPEIPQIQELRSKEIISEIQKRKIINNIIQGEAVNSKKALNLPEVKQGLVKIMGQEKADKYVSLLNKLTDIAQASYWKVPVEIQEMMWQTNKEGMAGAVGVDWENKKKKDEDLAKDILADIEKNGAEDLPKEVEDLFYETQPTIHARGRDFAMLIHEGVKGVYELIGAIAIPEDEEIAKTVLMNTDSLADEIEDIRNGPKMVADMRDYFNTFEEIKRDVIPNLREFVVGALCTFPAPEFNDIVLSILARDDKYRQTIQEIIDDKIAEVRKFQAEEALRKKRISGIDNDDNYNPQGKTSAPSEDVDYSTLTAEELESLLKTIDYSTLTKVELKELLDAAVKYEYYEEARSIHDYIKNILKESEFADEVWGKIHERGGYPSNPDPSQINESESFNDLYKGITLTMDVIDGKTRNKKGTIKTKVNEMVLEGNSYFLRCSGDVNVVYDKSTQEFVEGYKNQYLVYSVDEANSQIFDFLK